VREVNNYEVLVSNIGRVHQGTGYFEALGEYGSWVNESKSRHGGRAMGETVTLMKNGEPMREYEPDAQRPVTDLAFDRAKWVAGRIRETLRHRGVYAAVEETMRARRTKGAQAALVAGLVVGAILDPEQNNPVDPALAEMYLRAVCDAQTR